MTTDQNAGLLACPFCAHLAQDLRDALHPSGIRWREDDGQRHYIGADDQRDGTPCWDLTCLEHEGRCGASMTGDSREEVIAKWNARANVEAKDAEIAELRNERDYWKARADLLGCDRIDLANRAERLEAALRGMVNGAYAVCTSIDARGHRWCEAYLDEALPEARALLPVQGREGS